MRSLNTIYEEDVMTKILQKEHIKMNCPHCKLEATDTWICQLDSVLGKRYAYLCSNCEKLLGISRSLISNSSELKIKINLTLN